MSYGDGTERLHSDELIYRRVLVSHDLFNSETGKLSPEAFRPFKYDETGISVDRAKCRTIREAAQGRNRKGYFVAVLRVGDVHRAGLEVVPRPTPDNPGHAEIPALNYADRSTVETQQWKLLLARELTLRVEGPFIPGGP
jgi:hypothetical protein